VHEHFAQFYERDSNLVNQAAAFIRSGLSAGETSTNRRQTHTTTSARSPMLQLKTVALETEIVRRAEVEQRLQDREQELADLRHNSYT
jgi:hypothetical protein